MKVLIFEIWNKTPQFETGLEIAELHAEKNDEVHYVNIGGHIPFIEWQRLLQETAARRLFFKSIYNKKINKINQILNPNIEIHTSTLLSKNEIKDLKEDYTFQNLDELKEFYWEDMDLGMGAVSSLISLTNDLEPDIKGEFHDHINTILHSAKIVKKSFEKYLDKFNPDLVYFRNGRVSNYRVVYRVCQQRGQNFLIHDRGCDKDHYKISPDLRHNFDMQNNETIELWNTSESSLESKEKLAASFFEAKHKGIETGMFKFLQNQKKGDLPDNWDSKKYNIVYFNSSISEFAAVQPEQFKDNIFASQIDAIPFISETIKNEENVDFYIRLHPNLIKQDIKEKNMWSELEKYDKVNLIAPDSKIDTYALMLNADLIIVYLSTVGIEAAYLNKPVVQLSKSAYHKLGSTYLPKTKAEFKTILENRNIEAKDNLGAKMYGYYRKKFGSKFKFYQAETHGKGKFKGEDLQKEPLLFNTLKNIKNLKKI